LDARESLLMEGYEITQDLPIAERLAFEAFEPPPEILLQRLAASHFHSSDPV
jgi:hypothetical protein